MLKFGWIPFFFFLMGGLSVQQLLLCPIPWVGAILLLFRYPLSLNVHSCYLSPICTISSGIIQPREVRTYSVSSILITYDVFVIHVVYESAFVRSISNMGDSFTIFFLLLSFSRNLAKETAFKHHHI